LPPPPTRDPSHIRVLASNIESPFTVSYRLGPVRLILTGIEQDWMGLRKILTYIGFNPFQSSSIQVVSGLRAS
jgi:hypothetical protein